MTKVCILFLTVCSFLLITSCDRSENVIMSPDGKIKLEVFEKKGTIYYRIKKEKQLIVNKSTLGFSFNENSIPNHLRITGKYNFSTEMKWFRFWQEEDSIRNYFNEMRLYIENVQNKKRFDVIFRVFDEGVGFRYEFPIQNGLKDFVILDELTEFNFPKKQTNWSVKTNEEDGVILYELRPPVEWDTVSLSVFNETDNGLLPSLHEDNQICYTAMQVTSLNRKTKWKTLKTSQPVVKMVMKAPGVTPWRIILVEEKTEDFLLSKLQLILSSSHKQPH